jgi:hypothetical protein
MKGLSVGLSKELARAIVTKRVTGHRVEVGSKLSFLNIKTVIK